MRRREKNVPLVAAIAASGMTQNEIAARCGISTVTLSHAVNRRVETSPEIAAVLSTVLDVPAHKLGFEMGGAE